MRFKNYIGAHTDLTRLIAEARAELGPEAVIKTEYFVEGGFFGIGARKMVRVTAGVEDDPGASPFSPVRSTLTIPPVSGAPSTNGHHPPAVAAPASAPPLSAEPQPEPVSATHNTPPAPEPLPAALASPVAGHPVLETVLDELRQLRADLDSLKHLPQTASTPSGDSGQGTGFGLGGTAAYHRLIEQGVSPALARTLVQHAEDDLDPAAREDYAAVVTALTERIVAHCTARPASAPLPKTAPRVLMLIGPTGVGKTTTLAKLAAAFHLLDEQQVALVTADTYRIAAIDQLRTFAQIISLPLEVVFDPAEFQAALRLHGEVDVVLVDTAGRSPKDEARLAELKRFLQIEHPVETILVMAATTQPGDLRLIHERFRTAGIDGLIVTKLDESSALGGVLELLWDTHLPLVCLTNGQNVPDDLVRGTPAELVRRLVEQLFAAA